MNAARCGSGGIRARGGTEVGLRPLSRLARCGHGPGGSAAARVKGVALAEVTKPGPGREISRMLQRKTGQMSLAAAGRPH